MTPEELAQYTTLHPMPEMRYVRRTVQSVPSGIDPSFFLPQRITTEQDFLQQLWSSPSGEEEWRDVPVVGE